MSETRAIVYCVIPAELGPALHQPLRAHFALDPSVEVIVERRLRDRRRDRDRRASSTESSTPQAERRTVRATSGRRVADRRASLVSTDGYALPQEFASHADRLTFVERLEPSTVVLEDADTARLVARLQAGEASLFSQLYMRYFDRVYAYLRITLQDNHEAEDATQEVFIRVLEALPAYERRNVPFRAWLFRIVRNCAISRIRVRHRLRFEPPEQIARRGEAPHEDKSLDWLDDRQLVGLVEHLPLAQRQVVVLRYMLDLRSNEIAEILERSPEAVRQLHQRAMRFMRAQINPSETVPQIAQGRGRVQREAMRRQQTFSPVMRSRRLMLS